jgi:ribose transport system ATP-binding protein
MPAEDRPHSGTYAPSGEMLIGTAADAPQAQPAEDLALLASGVAKSFNGIRVLHPLDLKIRRGQVHMLLGQNGSGKSTLIKVLSGYHVPDDTGAECRVGRRQLVFGSPESSASIGLRFVHQDLGLIDTESIADNLLLGRKYPTRLRTIDGKALRARAVAALAGVGLDLDPRARAGDLSPAQRTGVAIARALWGWEGSCNVVVLDEPTATLPVHEVEHLHTTLRTVTASGVGVLYVTHNLDDVTAIGDYVSILRDGRLVASSPVAEMDHETMVHRLVGKEVEDVQRDSRPGELVTGSRDNTAATGVPVALTVRGLTTDVLKNVSFTVDEGEVVGIYGLTGSGRESVLGTLFGSVQRSSGTVMVGSRVVIDFNPVDATAAGLAYVPANRKTQGGFMLLSAIDNLSITDLRSISRRGGAINRRRERHQVADWFERLEVRPARAYDELLSTFSGGNQQKIVMAKWLRRSPAVLLLDEPTQGVDVGAKAQLHRQVLAVADSGTAVVVSSTDVQELASLSSRVIIMRQGRISGQLRGPDVTEDNINRAIHIDVDP